MLLLSRLLSVVVDVILFYVFFQTNNYTVIRKKNPLETEKPSRYIIYLALQPTRYTSRQLSSTSNKAMPSLVTLPVEIVYRILDHQEVVNIIWSMLNVCQRLDKIVNSYHRYQVNYFFILNVSFSSTSIILFISTIYN
jgi:hypothetical protein